MNKLTPEKRANILHLLVEGNSLRATSRIADVSYNTVLKFFADAGRACEKYQDTAFRNLSCKRVQVDEIWSFVYAKQKNVVGAKAAPGGAGDVWTWVGIDVQTKLVASWLVGSRDGDTAKTFVKDLASRLSNRIQLTSDGHKAYLEAVEDAFGSDIDYAMLQKIYGTTPEGEKRYSPAECIGCETKVIEGKPDPKHISTSYVQRQNLTMRMSMRRFTRLTNGFSKKVENHTLSVALHYMHYNFCRIHKSLRITPAMAAGVTDHVWTIAEIVAIIEAEEPAPKKRGPYKKKSTDNELRA